MRTTYRFAGAFTVPAPRSRVHEVLLDLESYPRWWHEVRAVASLGPDDALVVCRSVLPYDLDLHLRAVSRSEDRLEVEVDGPFSGWVRWGLTPVAGERGETTLICWEQEVGVVSPLLVAASYAVRPMMGWNHARMMAGAARGLRQESAATAAS